MARWSLSPSEGASPSPVPPAPGWRDRSTIVDGNALAGPLAALFAGDATVLVAVCGGCGHTAPLAEAVVEADDAAFLVRCRACTHTLFVLRSARDGVELRIEALGSLRLPG